MIPAYKNNKDLIAAWGIAAWDIIKWYPNKLNPIFKIQIVQERKRERESLQALSNIVTYCF